MTEKNPRALTKMQEIANRLISNTPELVKILDSDSQLRPKRPNSPFNKKNKQQSAGVFSQIASTKNDLTSNDYQQRYKNLTSELQSWKDKTHNLQEQITIIKQRFVQRQIQYRKIIEQLQEQLKSKSSLDNTDRNRMAQINQLHKQIMGNIGTIQTKTSKILIEQQSDIRRYFHKKINEIKQKFKEDKINKTEKDQQYMQKQKQMMSELQWIKNIAHKIDMENQTLMKKYSTLKSDYDIQEKDKDLLLKELLMKKKQNAVLKSQVDQYEKLLNEVSKEMEDGGDQALSQSGLSNSQSKQQMKFKEIEQPVQASRVDPIGMSRRHEATVNHLNNIITKERKKIRQLKNLYMKEIMNKSDLEKIIRQLVQDVRESVMELQKDRAKRKKKQSQFDVNAREQLLEKILTNERILTLIYDKTFYAGERIYTGNQPIPPQLEKILEHDEDDGFY